MTPVFTATPDVTTGSVLLEIPLAGIVEKVLRTDANGVAEVRGLQGQLPASNGTRVNLEKNPSFETGLNGWTTTSTGWSLTTTNPGGALSPTRGSKCLSFSTPSWTSPEGSLKHTLTVTAGKTYTVSMDTSIAAPWTYVVTGAPAKTFVAPDLAWTRVSYTFTATVTGTVTGTFTIPPNTLWFMLDAVLVEEAPVALPYFDGSTGATEGAVVSWTGTAHASTSRLVPSATLILTDYEAAAGPVTYSTVGSGGGVSVSTRITLNGPWLLAPKAPNYSVELAQVTTYEAGRTSQTTLHEVIGREDPLVTFGPLGSRSGSMDLYCQTLAQARAIEQILGRRETLMLKQNVPGLDMYFTATGTRVRPHAEEGEGSSWALTVDYRELKRPSGNQAGALGWTFDALASAYPTFDAVAIAFATFDALTVRRTN